MTHDDFVADVRARAGLDSPEAAEQAIRATLVTLGELLGRGLAENLAAQLPPEVAPHAGGHPAIHDEQMTVEEFLRHVASREADGVDLPTAARHVRAVIEVLREATSGRIMEKVRRTLPEDFRPVVVMRDRA